MNSSPFILQKSIEESDRFVFLQDDLMVNDICIGQYLINKTDDGFRIITNNGENIKDVDIELQLSYDQQKVVLRLSDLYTAYQLADFHDGEMAKLVPGKNLIDDEKAEL